MTDVDIFDPLGCLAFSIEMLQWWSVELSKHQLTQCNDVLCIAQQ